MKRSPGMKQNAAKNEPLFLLGAGFNRDASQEAGPIECESIYIGKYKITPNYPLVSDMWKICFPGETADSSISIEEKIQEHLLRGNAQPIKLLCEEISKCDYYLAPRLMRNRSCYQLFFEHFSDSHFLSFNYDSLVEAFLLRRGVWRPSDGYGTPVEMSPYRTDGKKIDDRPSHSYVIHLHGSICIYESAVAWDTTGDIPYLQLKEKPVFKFDPNSTAQLFYPYQKAPLTIGEDREIERRVIAPVADKSTGLKGEFVKEMYKKSRQFIQSTQRLICIGYDFNKHDLLSYQPILHEVQKNSLCELVIISPNSPNIAAHLIDAASDLESRLRVVEMTFKQWAQADFKIH